MATATEPMNFDCATDSELETYIASARLTGTEGKLRHYAIIILEARKARLAGCVNEAFRLETWAEALYQQLPASARW